MKLLGQIVSVGFALWLAQASAVELSIPQVVSVSYTHLTLPTKCWV